MFLILMKNKLGRQSAIILVQNSDVRTVLRLKTAKSANPKKKLRRRRTKKKKKKMEPILRLGGRLRLGRVIGFLLRLSHLLKQSNDVSTVVFADEVAGFR